MRGTIRKYGPLAVVILVAVCAALAQRHAPPPITPDRTGMTNVGEAFLPNIPALYSAAIDPITGFGYFGSSHSPVLSKIDLNGPVPKVVQDGLPSSMPEGVNSLWALMVDFSDPNPLKHYVYAVGSGGKFGNQVLKMAPGDATHTPQVVAALQPTSASGFVMTGVIDTSDPDPARHYAYFVAGVRNQRPKVLRVRLSDLSDQGAETLQMDGVGFPAIIDTVRHYAYFTGGSGQGKGKRTPQIAKLNLATFHDGGTSVATLSIDSTKPGDGIVRDGFDYPGTNGGFVMDEVHGYAYLGTLNGVLGPKNDTWPNNQSMVVQVKLGDGDSFPAQPLKTFDLRVGERGLSVAVIDVAHGNVYFGTDNTYPAHVYMIHVGDGKKPMREVGRLDLNPGSLSPDELPHDGNSSPGYTVEQYGETFIRSMILDSRRNAIYLGTDSKPGQVIKVGINGKK